MPVGLSRAVITKSNQSWPTDSFIALDRARTRVRFCVMLHDQPVSALILQVLVLDRIDASQNMARYYVLSIEATLFGDTAMVREWGRIGRSGRRRTELYAQHDGACTALGTWLDRKLRRGYRLREASAHCGPDSATRSLAI